MNDNLFVVYADYDGEVESEVFGAYATLATAKKNLKSVVYDFFVNNVFEDCNDDSLDVNEEFEKFWNNGISEENTHFVDETEYYGVPARFLIAQVPFGE